MKIVLFGASGLVGSHVMAAGLAAGHNVVGTTRATGSPILRRLELGDQGATIELLEAERPEVVIYAAGWTWVDGCEADSDRSRRENFDIPSDVSRWCSRNAALFLYYSSSYVFDGRSGNYAECDSVSPINIYGRHKADAEKSILDISSGSALIPRLICVWGAESSKKNFVYQMLEAARSHKSKQLPSDQLGNPTWAGDIAYWSIRLIELKASGVWHLAGSGPDMSRVQWAQSILDGLSARGLRSSLAIVPYSTEKLGQRALRPLRAGMLTAKIQALAPLVCREPSDIPVTIC